MSLTDTIERTLVEHARKHTYETGLIQCSCGWEVNPVERASGFFGGLDWHGPHRAHVAAEIQKALRPALHRAWMTGVQDQWTSPRPGMRILETTGPYWDGSQASQAARRSPNDPDREGGPACGCCGRPWGFRADGTFWCGGNCDPLDQADCTVDHTNGEAP